MPTTVVMAQGFTRIPSYDTDVSCRQYVDAGLGISNCTATVCSWWLGVFIDSLPTSGRDSVADGVQAKCEVNVLGGSWTPGKSNIIPSCNA
jgi:hypothetical protein